MSKQDYQNQFFVPEYAPRIHVLKLSGRNSIESEKYVKKLLLLGRLITERITAPAVKTLFNIAISILVLTLWVFWFTLTNHSVSIICLPTLKIGVRIPISYLIMNGKISCTKRIMNTKTIL